MTHVDLPPLAPLPPSAPPRPRPPILPKRILRAPARRRFASLRAIFALILREMSSTYGRSPGGYLWAILEPVAGIALLSLVFSAVFRSPPLGISFPIFYATGMLPFLLFLSTVNKTASAVRYSKQLLAYPTVTFADAIIARVLLNVVTQLMVSYLIFSVAMAIFDTIARLDLALVFQAYALAIILGVGVGTLNCYFTTRFEVYGHAWSILTRPLFIISGVFILYDGIPEPYKTWLWWNPLIHVIGLMRDGFYASYDARYVSELYVIFFALIPLTLGLLLLRRTYRDLLDRL